MCADVQGKVKKKGKGSRLFKSVAFFCQRRESRDLEQEGHKLREQSLT